MNIQDFHDLMSGFQSLFTCVAIILGGAWGWYTFRALGKLNQARLDVQKGESELNRLQIEHQKMEQEIQKNQLELQNLEVLVKRYPVVEISIDAEQTLIPGDSARYISSVVDIQNNGSRTVRLSFDENPFSVYPVTIKSDGGPDFSRNKQGYPVPRASYPQGAAPSVLVRPGGREQLPFFFRVESPGLYFLTFWAPLSEADERTAREEGVTRPASWVGKKYLVVN